MGTEANRELLGGAESSPREVADSLVEELATKFAAAMEALRDKGLDERTVVELSNVLNGRIIRLLAEGRDRRGIPYPNMGASFVK